MKKLLLSLTFTFLLVTIALRPLTVSAHGVLGSYGSRIASVKLTSVRSKPLIAQKTNYIYRSDHAPYRCLDADLNTMANNGTKVQLWDCNGSSEQSWNEFVNSFGYWTIQSNHAPYRCLDADLNTIANNGTKVQLWDCNGSHQQSWYAFNQNNGDAGFLNQEAPGSRCLDADLNTMANNGTKVQLWDCNYNLQQTWYVG